MSLPSEAQLSTLEGVRLELARLYEVASRRGKFDAARTMTRLRILQALSDVIREGQQEEAVLILRELRQARESKTVEAVEAAPSTPSLSS